MKIKYLAAAFTLFMGMIMAYFWLETAGDGQAVLDMVYYNKELKNISRAADEGMERTLSAPDFPGLSPIFPEAFGCVHLKYCPRKKRPPIPKTGKFFWKKRMEKL